MVRSLATSHPSYLKIHWRMRKILQRISKSNLQDYVKTAVQVSSVMMFDKCMISKTFALPAQCLYCVSTLLNDKLSFI